MYVTGREITAHNGRLPNAIALASGMTATMNEQYGSSFGVSVEIGGSLNKLWISGFWQTLDEYQSFVDAYTADPKFQVAMGTVDSVMADGEDQIGMVLRAPGERKEFASMNTGRVKSTHLAQGIEFAVNAAELCSSITGNELGLVVPVTGDRFEINFVAYADSLQGLRDNDEQLGANEDYQTMFAASQEMFENQYSTRFLRFVS